MATVRELLSRGSDLPTESPRRDAEILLCHCLGQTRTWLYTWPDEDVASASAERYRNLLARRRAGEPVAYLTGEREFWSLSLAVNDSTLIPRPETETLVSWALELPLPGDTRALDLGTGSGAIALALASERPTWAVSGVDSNPAAVALAKNNASVAGLPQVNFLQSDWFGAIAPQRFHLLAANPPYIDAADPHLGQGDVRFEPRSALVAPDAGLADLAHIVALAPQHLVDAGWLLLEHGFEQGEAVRKLLDAAGFFQVATRCDLAGLERISGGCWHAQ